MNFLFIYFICYVITSVTSYAEEQRYENDATIFKSAVCFQSNGSFSYQLDSLTGPHCWAVTFPQCADIYQSPINIDRNAAQRIYTKKRLICSKWIEKPHFVEAENTGKTIVLKFEYKDGKKPILLPRPISQEHYQFDRANFHFIGSEHSFDGCEKYEMEAHLIFFNLKYITLENALNYQDGLMVIGKFFQKQYGIDADFSFVHKLDRVGAKIRLTDNRAFALADIFGLININFYTYFGSLTTPGCNQVVTFLLDDRPLKISEFTLRLFSYVRSDEAYMSPNIRPIQPTNGRQILYYVKS